MRRACESLRRDVAAPGPTEDAAALRYYRVWYDVGADHYPMAVLRTDEALDLEGDPIGEKTRAGMVLRAVGIEHEGVVVMIESGAWVARGRVPLVPRQDHGDDALEHRATACLPVR